MAGAVLANAQAFITGRYHPAIFASLGGTPCIFLGADSHKTRSLQDVLEYESKAQFSALPQEDEISEICQLAERYIEQGDELRSSIKSVAQKCAIAARQVVDLISH